MSVESELTAMWEGVLEGERERTLCGGLKFEVKKAVLLSLAWLCPNFRPCEGSCAHLVSSLPFLPSFSSPSAGSGRTHVRKRELMLQKSMSKKSARGFCSSLLFGTLAFRAHLSPSVFRTVAPYLRRLDLPPSTGRHPLNHSI